MATSSTVDGTAEETATLTVHVVDQATDAPITGALVVVRDGSSGAEVASGSTDLNGDLFAGTLPAGEYSIEVAADGYYSAFYRPWVIGPTVYTIPLQRIPLPGTLAVRVVDQFTGDPIGNAGVVVYDMSWSVVAAGATDESGLFLTGELPGGLYYVEASADRYPYAAAYANVDGSVEITLALDPILPGTLTVFAVNQETGEPISGATVVVRDYWAGGIEVATGTTDDSGAFVTGELPAGDYTVEVSAANHLPGYAYPYVSIDGPVTTTVGLVARFPGSVTVTVVDQTSGAPVVGATVVLSGPEQNELSRGITDENGIFVTPELPGGNTWITVAAQGYWEGIAYLWLNGSTAVTLPLQPFLAGDLTVTVVDGWYYTPVAGASVVVRDHFSGADVASGTTDGDGRFTAANLPGGTYDVEVTAAGYFAKTETATVDGSRDFFLTLQPRVAGTLTVSVRDWSFGEPIANASVSVMDAASGNQVATGTTDASGNFVTETLDGGLYEVSVTAAGFLAGETQVLVSGASAVWVALQPQGGHLTVRAIDQVSAAPIAGATVRVYDFWGEIAAGTTDATGAFVTGELPPGDYFVDVTADGYFGGSERARVRGESEIVLALTPRLPGALTVSVVDGVSGEPIRDALVVVSDSGGSERSRGTTGKDGSFTTGELTGDYYRVEVVADGYWPGYRFPLVNGPTAVEIALYPSVPGVLTVQVMDVETGAPVGGASVTVRQSSSGAVIASGTTKKTGAFETDELPEGYYAVEVSADGYFLGGTGVWVHGDTGVQVWMQQRLTGILTLRILESGSDLPIPGANVVLYEPGTMSEIATGTTGDDGVFVTGPLEGGDYLASVMADGYLPVGSAYIWFNGDAERTIHLVQGSPGTLQTFVFDESTGQPIAGATVTVRDSAAGGIEVATGTTDASGFFVTAALPAGDYTVDVTASGYLRSSPGYVRIDGPRYLSLPMRSEAPGTLTLYVYDWQLGTIGGATVIVRDDDGTEVGRGTTDAGGIFVTDELPAGKYHLDVSAPGHHPVQDYPVIVNGPTWLDLSLSLRLEATMALSVTSGAPGTKVRVDGDGFAAGETVTITWQSLDGTVLGVVTTKKDGTFSSREVVIPDAPAGTYRIVAIGQESDVVAIATITVTA